MNPYYTAIAQRANHRCEYCKAPKVVFNFPFEVEHIVPLSRQGSNDESYRALGVEVENGISWFWIGTHAKYDRLIGKS